jgi:hypothetical protein
MDRYLTATEKVLVVDQRVNVALVNVLAKE